MNITPKSEATELATFHLDEDAVKYIRQLEAAISLWQGVTAIILPVPTKDVNIANHVAKLYREQGWDVEVKYREYGDGSYQIILS
jgi:hypothetical protein